MKTLQHIHTVNTKLQNKNQIIELKKNIPKCALQNTVYYVDKTCFAK